MKISCGILCKGDNEFNELTKAVNSVAPYVDGVFITTSDKESSKVKMYCEHNKLHYSHTTPEYNPEIYFIDKSDIASKEVWEDSKNDVNGGLLGETYEEYVKSMEKTIKEHKPIFANFAAARNFNFEQANKHDTYDFNMWIDVDDILVGGQYLREIATNAKTNHIDIVFFTYWYGCAFEGEPSESTFREVQLEHMRERLIRPGTNVWKSRLHETPVPVEGYEPRYSKYPYDAKERPIVIMHTSKDDVLNEKMARNKKILELQLEEEREKGTADPRTLLYLMKIYSEMGTPELCEKSINMGSEYLAKSGWDQERGVCYEQMGIAYGKLGDDANACKSLHKAIEEHPGQVLFYIRLAQSYFNLKKYKQCEHWMKVGANLNIENDGNDQTNIKAIKTTYAELLLNLNWHIKKDVKKSLDAALMLYKENPTDANKENLLFVQDANDLDDACRRVDKLGEYLDSIGEARRIVPLLDVLPIAITEQPFAIKIRQKYASARKWGRNEICYFANFGGPFLEKWDCSNLENGIGGSETAVIELSKEWSKLGYKVTVYGDPKQRGVDQYGINWLPYYFFNYRDFFNIFIQWRSWELAGKIKCRKFWVDLHDIVSDAALSDEQCRNIDKVFFKSKVHRSLLMKLPQDKVCVVGNGVRV